MARYNMWQNAGQVAAADMLSDAARRQDRAAFFGSIAGTLNHLLWADLTWMARFDGGAPPGGGIQDSADMMSTWAGYKSARVQADQRILEWSGRVAPERLAGDLSWHSGALGQVLPMGLCVQHFFNHQTHHRGQVHAMLTAAGARPGPTDLIFMPNDIGM
ncbi:damage-inducible protein DinB [Pelagivirga sediminicola]|uniref:Damage-inducible protein DinB n=2 Tax=Pelagivirga sediminicola TaxID=2170575 RepID=A0A2T7GC26_9RHOB|nr:damage-inducible protein DinB [Pelagivirga sediminicola]